MGAIPRGTGPANEAARDAVVPLLCDELSKGISIRVACDIVGISEGAYYRWQKLAEEGREDYILLVRRLKQARAAGYATRLGKIAAAAEATDDWRAQAWMVEHLYPGWGGKAAILEEIREPRSPQEDVVGKQMTTSDRIAALWRIGSEAGLLPSVVKVVDQQDELPEEPEQPAAVEPEQPAVVEAVETALGDGQWHQLDEVAAATGVEVLEVAKAAYHLGAELGDQASPGRPSGKQVRLSKGSRPSYFGGQAGEGLGDYSKRRARR